MMMQYSQLNVPPELYEKKSHILDAWLHRFDTDQSVSFLGTGTIFLTMHGSHIYGLNTESSDVDMSGVAIPPNEYFFGFLKNYEQAQFNKPDGAIFNIKKFFKLAADNNPNVMELPFIEPKYWVAFSSEWIKIVEHKHDFLSKKVRHTYAGYAHAQLKRIETHRRWLLNPPRNVPTREDFGLPENRLISRDQQGALEQMMEDGLLTLDSNYMERLQKENEYDRVKKEWKQYQTWKEERNPVRAELEAKFGYDTKHAAHLVRLIRQCKEILLTGTLNVERKEDREELLGIRRGALTYEGLMLWVEKEASDEVLKSYEDQSKLPHEPNRKYLDNLCVSIIQQFGV